MQKIIFVLLLAYLTATSSFCIAEPNKSETIHYLKDKYSDSPEYFLGQFKFNKSGCEFSVDVDDAKWGFIVDMKKVRVEINSFENGQSPYQSVDLKCPNRSTECIDHTETQTGDIYDASSSITIVRTTQQELAGQIYRALTHLRSLCTGKKELF